MKRGETAEAKFAKVMDRVQPIMLNAATDGKAWQEHQVQLRKILNRNEKTAEGSTVFVGICVAEVYLAQCGQR